MRKFANDHLTARLRLGAVTVLAIAGLCGSIDSWSQAKADRTVEQQVLDADDDYVKAELSHDEASIRRLIDDRFVYNKADGTTMDREGFVRQVVALPMVGQSIRERTVIVEGDVGIVFATTDLRFASPNGPERLSSLRYTCAYVRRGGEWRMLALQMQTRPK